MSEETNSGVIYIFFHPYVSSMDQTWVASFALHALLPTEQFLKTNYFLCCCDKKEKKKQQKLLKEGRIPSASLCKDTVHHDEKGMAMRAAAALVEEARELVSQAVSAVWELIDVNPGSFLSFSSFSVKGMVSSSSGMDLLSSGKPL